VTAFGASAKMQPPSAKSQAFDTTCSACLGRWVDTIPLGFHRLLSDFRLLQLLLIDGLHRPGLWRRNEIAVRAFDSCALPGRPCQRTGALVRIANGLDAGTGRGEPLGGFPCKIQVIFLDAVGMNLRNQASPARPRRLVCRRRGPARMITLMPVLPLSPYDRRTLQSS
jgi:hypothetical protein